MTDIRIENLAEREGYRIIKWYEDHGLTGTESANRPEFQQLLRDAQSGRFEAILLLEQSRFSREDIFDVMLHWRLLREAGVDVLQFGLSLDGYSWALLVKVDDGRCNTEVGRTFQRELRKALLDQVVQDVHKVLYGEQAES